jgi:hypothetical protein
MRAFTALAIVVVGSLTACQKAAPDITAGKPYIVLHNVDPECVRERLVTRMTDQGWKVLQVGGGRLIAERRSPPFIESVARRAGYDSPLVRMTLIGVEMQPNIEIIIDPFIVINPGTKSERVEPIAATAEMQVTFDTAGRQLEAYCGRK